MIPWFGQWPSEVTEFGKFKAVLMLPHDEDIQPLVSDKTDINDWLKQIKDTS